MPTVSDVIRDDHREFERMFDMLREPKKRLLTLPVVVMTLAAHSRAEEEVVYPAVRDETDSSDVVAHSQAEHVQADELLERLLMADNEEFEELCTEFIDSVRHHIEEEESDVLPRLETLDPTRQESLAAEFAEVRSAHLLKARPIDLTKQELQQQASNAGLSGASNTSKRNLEGKLRRMAKSD